MKRGERAAGVLELAALPSDVLGDLLAEERTRLDRERARVRVGSRSGTVVTATKAASPGRRRPGWMTVEVERAGRDWHLELVRRNGRVSVLRNEELDPTAAAAATGAAGTKSTEALLRELLVALTEQAKRPIVLQAPDRELVVSGPFGESRIRISAGGTEDPIRALTDHLRE